MANGFQGISIQTEGDVQYIAPKYGLVGLSIQFEDKQYIAPQFGISGISIITEFTGKDTTKKRIIK